MGKLTRTTFDMGWYPSADAINGPKNSLLRMDNCDLDEQGAVALRPGSARIQANGLADPSIDSIFSLKLNGATRRYVGAGNHVYHDGTGTLTATAATIAGAGDISFGAHQGQVLYARSTSKKKHDGTTERNWGIAAPANTPALTAVPALVNTLAVCGNAESPAFSADEGTTAFVTDRYGNANSAVEVTPDATTGRGTITRQFSGVTDLNMVMTAVGTDEDLISLYAYVTEPQFTETITLMIDVNDGTFQDYFYYTWVHGEPIDLELSPSEFLQSVTVIASPNRERVLAQLETNRPSSITFKDSKNGWNYFSVPRGTMRRIGSTANVGWATGRAVRVVIEGNTGGAGAAVRIDEISMTGGQSFTLRGRYKVRVVAVRNDGVYQALSAPGVESAEIELRQAGLLVELSTTGLDTQVNELWVFMMGGRLNGYYRYQVKTGGPFSGTASIPIISGDLDALITNVRMETDNGPPPDNIIGIIGPHFDRTLALTATHLYASRERNPDSFATEQVIRVGDATEAALWLEKNNEYLYVGTTKDIYRFDGDWTPRADGTLNVAKRPLGVTSPPVSGAHAIGQVDSSAGDVLVYLSKDGWRILNGPLLINSQIELLWRGQARHSISPVAIANASARFRCAVGKNLLVAITPEGQSADYSSVLHVYHFGKQRWYRWTYPTSWRSLHTDIDGVLLGGDAFGYVSALDRPAHDDDTAFIPVTLWTVADDNDEPFQIKDVENLSLRMNTGGAAAAVNLHLDNYSVTARALSSTQAGVTYTIHDVSGLSQCSQMQLRITGSFGQFQFRGFDINYLDNPRPLVFHDTGFVDLSPGAIRWIRRLRIKARSASTLRVIPYWDGVPGIARDVTVSVNTRKEYLVPLGREDKGKTCRVVITSPEPSQVYWVEFEFAGTGKQNQKKRVAMPEAA